MEQQKVEHEHHGGREEGARLGGAADAHEKKLTKKQTSR